MDTCVKTRFALLAACAVFVAAKGTARAAPPAGMIPYPVLKPAINARTQDPAGDAGAAVLRSESEGGNVILPASKGLEGAPAKRMACPPSPLVAASFPKPKHVRHSNNLWRRTGAVRHAAGQYIRIDGIIRDSECMPVPGARVFMWQRDQSGMYEARYRKLVENERRHPDYDQNFGYSGAATTNNAGEFSFISIMPGVVNPASPPHVNIEIRHDDFKTATTRIYLLPNGTPPDSSASPTRNPFQNSGIPPLYNWSGVAAGSAVMTSEEGGFGVQFFADITLRGKVENLGLY